MAELTMVYGRYNELDNYGIHGVYKSAYKGPMYINCMCCNTKKDRPACLKLVYG